MRISTRHITIVYITPQILNNFNIHYYIIILYHPILFYVIIFKTKILTEIIFVSYYGVTDTVNYNCIHVFKKSPLRWPNYWPKYVGEDIIKNYNHIIILYYFILLLLLLLLLFKTKILTNYICFILWSDCDTVNYNCIPV